MQPQQRVKIIVDSPSDIPPEWRAKWDIAVIPAFITFGMESYPDDDSALPKAAFYKRLAESKTLPGTAAPPADLAEAIIRAQLAGAEQVIVFTVAHQFSSLYNSIRLAGQRVDAERVTVIDSGSVSMGEGWQALAAAEVAARGGSKEEAIAAANSARDRISLLAVLDTLENLRRGGRISSLVASLGAILQIKPIFEVRDGSVEAIARVRTLGKGMQYLIDETRKRAPLERVALLHTNAPHLAEQLRVALADILPSPENVAMFDITTAIGTHIGPGCAGVIAVRKE